MARARKKLSRKPCIEKLEQRAFFAADLAIAKSFGSPQLEVARGIAVDSLGNCFTAGQFSSTVDFDPGPGVTNLTAAGFDDIFISKLDSQGNLVWAKRIGGIATEVANDVAVDSNGDVVVVGFFIGSAPVDFDPGTGVATLTDSGNGGVFVVKFSNAGDFLWVKGLVGPGDIGVQDLDIDANNNILLAGGFFGDTDFDPGPGSLIMNATGSTFGANDGYVEKLNSNGDLVWVRRLGGDSNDIVTGVATGPTGDVFLSGNFTGTADMDPGAENFFITSNGEFDAFLGKLDSSGVFQWAHAFGSSDFDGGGSIDVDLQNNVYVSGYFGTTVDFDPSSSVQLRTSEGYNDVYVAKYTSSGSYVWAGTFGGTLFDSNFDLVVDATGAVYSTGRFVSEVDFDPGAGIANRVSNGDYDIYLQKLDTNGTLEWAYTYGAASGDTGLAVAVDSNMRLWTLGYFYLTMEVDPTSSTVNLTSIGNLDIYVLAFDQPSSTIVGRGVFYNGASTGNNPSSLATDKSPLLPGQSSSFSNYTNYLKGLNGLVFDVAGLPSSTTNSQILSSLLFAQWNGIDSVGFASLPSTAVPVATILTGAGVGGSTRVSITFPDNTLQNTWLRVTVLANAITGLAANDVFYFGNVIGELDFGNTATRLRVNGQDAALILANQSPGANSAGATNKFDLDRNGRVNGQDYAILLANQQAAGIVAPITAPSLRLGQRASSAGEGEAIQGNLAILSGVAKSGAEPISSASLGTQSVGSRWTGETNDLIRIDSTSEKNLMAKNDVPATGFRETIVKKKRSRIEFSTNQLDSYFARLESATELDASE